jgi:transposase-like protein
MYSYEDRTRALKLYIKLGKRTGATILQLGYPTKNSLKSWHREHEQGHDFRRAMYVQGRSIQTSRREWPLNITSTMIVALWELERRWDIRAAIRSALGSMNCTPIRESTLPEKRGTYYALQS